jgi:hypothetical protein
MNHLREKEQQRLLHDTSNHSPTDSTSPKIEEKKEEMIKGAPIHLVGKEFRGGWYPARAGVRVEKQPLTKY